MSAFSNIASDKFVPVVIREKTEVYPALQRFFSTRGIHA
jgi:hypothetical protein